MFYYFKITLRVLSPTKKLKTNQRRKVKNARFEQNSDTKRHIVRAEKTKTKAISAAQHSTCHRVNNTGRRRTINVLSSQCVIKK